MTIIASVASPSKIIESLTLAVKQSADEKRTYEDKLENATGIDVYKYIILIKKVQVLWLLTGMIAKDS